MPDTLSRILSLLFTAGRVFHEQSGESGRPDFVSMLRLHTLRYVNESGQPLMKDVARHLSITPSSTTSLINSLVVAKLLARHLDHHDRRIVRLVLTPKGRLFLRRGLAAKKARIRVILSRLNHREQQQLIQILQKITSPIHYSQSV